MRLSPTRGRQFPAQFADVYVDTAVVGGQSAPNAWRHSSSLSTTLPARASRTASTLNSADVNCNTVPACVARRSAVLSRVWPPPAPPLEVLACAAGASRYGASRAASSRDYRVWAGSHQRPFPVRQCGRYPRPRREHQYRRRGKLPQAAQYFQALRARQHDIKHNGIVVIFRGNG